MDSGRVGSFIAGLRREKSMTQQELAERLGVTNKAVSKWETGEGYPEITILPALSEILGVTVDKLLRGERGVYQGGPGSNSHTDSSRQADYLIDSAILKFRNMTRISLGIALAGIISFFIITFVTLYEWIGFGAFLLFEVSSMVMFSILYNNLIASAAGYGKFFPEGSRNNELTILANRQLVISIYSWAFLLLLVIPFVLLDNRINLQGVLPFIYYLNALPLFLLAGGTVVHLVCRRLCDIMGIDQIVKIMPILSPESQKSMAAHNAVSALFGALLCLIAFLPAFLPKPLPESAALIREPNLFFAGIFTYACIIIMLILKYKKDIPIPSFLIYSMRNLAAICIVAGGLATSVHFEGYDSLVSWQKHIDWLTIIINAIYAIAIFLATNLLIGKKYNPMRALRSVFRTKPEMCRSKKLLNLVSLIYGPVLAAAVFFTQIRMDAPQEGFNSTVALIVLLTGLSAYAAFALFIVLKKDDVRAKLVKAFCAIRNLICMFIMADGLRYSVSYSMHNAEIGWKLHIYDSTIEITALVMLVFLTLSSFTIWFFEYKTSRPATDKNTTLKY